MLALTLESAQAWALIIGSIGGALGSAIAAWYAAKARSNSGDAKTAAVAAANQLGVAPASGGNGSSLTRGLLAAPPAPSKTLADQVTEQGTKLDDLKSTAEKTAAQTDGQLTALRAELMKALAEKDAYQHMLSETTTLLAAAQAAIGSAKHGAVTAAGGRRADDTEKKDDR